MFLIPQIVLFGVTAYQDFKDRAISWYLPLLIVLTGFLAAVFNDAVFWKDYLASLCFVVLQLFGLFVYLAVKSKTVKIHLTRDFLGLGDILFFLAVIPFFSFKVYVVLMISGLLFSFLAQRLVYLFKRVDSVPLAGWLSVYYSLYLIFVGSI